MRTIRLIKTPGGAQSVEIAAGTTYAEFMKEHGIDGYTVSVNGGQSIDETRKNLVIGPDVRQIFASQTIKGN